MAVFTEDTSLVTKATNGLVYITNNVDDDGWLINAVDPYAFNVPLAAGAHSPEGQSFVLLLHAAYRDYEQYATNLAIALKLSSLSIGLSHPDS